MRCLCRELPCAKCARLGWFTASHRSRVLYRLRHVSRGVHCGAKSGFDPSFISRPEPSRIGKGRLAPANLPVRTSRWMCGKQARIDPLIHGSTVCLENLALFTTEPMPGCGIVAFDCYEYRDVGIDSFGDACRKSSAFGLLLSKSIKEQDVETVLERRLNQPNGVLERGAVQPAATGSWPLLLRNADRLSARQLLQHHVATAPVGLRHIRLDDASDPIPTSFQPTRDFGEQRVGFGITRMLDCCETNSVA